MYVAAPTATIAIRQTTTPLHSIESKSPSIVYTHYLNITSKFIGIGQQNGVVGAACFTLFGVSDDE